MYTNSNRHLRKVNNQGNSNTDYRKRRSPSPVKNPKTYIPSDMLYDQESEILQNDEEIICREYNLTEREYWIYKSIFDVIDYKKKNQLEPQQMRILLQHLKIDVTNDKKFLYEFFAELDSQGKGYFSFQDFLGLMVRGNDISRQENNHLRAVFNQLKKRDSYSLNIKDVARAFRQNNFNLDDKDIKEIYKMMLEKSKLEKGSEFSYSEFYDIMMEINTKFFEEFRNNKF